MLLGTVQAVSFSADPAHGRFPPPRTVARPQRPANRLCLFPDDEPGEGNEARHHLSGGAHGPDPVQALLQAGPPDAVQPAPAATGITML
jgi:hypothetical protein